MQRGPTTTSLDEKRCYRALETRDARFDGRFFTAVRTTGVYCRPICPARCPKLENVTFYTTAAEAHEAGYRPCLRCRPESSPSLAAWRGTSTTVSRALAMIHEGALDGEDVGVEHLAERLGIGARQLRRLFEEHLGVPPVVVAQTRRVLFAKQLLHQTSLGMTDVASAAGFGSVRRFNAAFQAMVGRSPSAIRREGAARATARSAGRLARATSATEVGGVLEVRLSYAPPYDFGSLLAFFAARAIGGVESVTRASYARTFELDGGPGYLEVRQIAGANALGVTIRAAEVRQIAAVVARVRRMFDTEADATTIERQLGRDPRLGKTVRGASGLRVPGAWDGFELAVRAVVGQQITVVEARRILGLLVETHGEEDPDAGPSLTRRFPTARRLAASDLSHLPMPRSRSSTLRGLAAAFVEEPRLFERQRYASLEDAVRRLTAITGVGPWTAQYVALRAMHDPDAFPDADAALLRAMSRREGTRVSARELADAAEAWRPWRAYAAQHLWTDDGAVAHARTKPRKERP